MHLDEFLRPRILIVAGKGGVGKTTVSAALALVAARRDRKVCIVQVDPKGSLPRLFGGEALGYEPTEISPGLWGINITPEEALVEYLHVQFKIKGISRVFSGTHLLDYVTTAAPGLKDILLLGKVWYLEQGNSPTTKQQFDTIVVDAPASGHMITFLSAPFGLSDALRAGPLHRQSEWLIGMLRDKSRTRVHLVTLAEEMPLSETLETAEILDTKIGIGHGAIFANGVYGQLLDRKQKALLETLVEEGRTDELQDAASAAGIQLDGEDLDAMIDYAHFISARRAIQMKHLKALRKAVGEPVLDLPFLFSAGIALPDLETLADRIEDGVAAL